MKRMIFCLILALMAFITNAQEFNIQQNVTGNNASNIRGQTFLATSLGTGTGSPGSDFYVQLKSIKVVYSGGEEAEKLLVYPYLPTLNELEGPIPNYIIQSSSKTQEFPYTVYHFNNFIRRTDTHYFLFQKNVSLEYGGSNYYNGGNLIRNNLGELEQLSIDLKFQIELKAIAPPTISVSQNGDEYVNNLVTFTFPKTQVGNVTESSFTVGNKGTSELIIDTIYFSDNDFTAPKLVFPIVIQKGEKVDLLYQFAPLGKKQSTVKFSIKNNDPNQNIFSVSAMVTSEFFTEPPSIFACQPYSPYQINLLWGNTYSPEKDYFIIERSTAPTTGFVKIATVPKGVCSYIDDYDLASNNKYYYRIKTQRENSFSEYSKVVSGTTGTGTFGNWVRKQKAPFKTHQAVAFSIGNEAFYGTGLNDTFLASFRKYNPSKDEWTLIAALPGVGRYVATAFVIGNEGYVGLGITAYEGDKFTTHLNDFYKYNPATNVWSKIADFPGASRFRLRPFVINGKAYLAGGCSWSDCYKDCYEYTPQTNTWRRVADLPTTGGNQIIGFSANNKGYIALLGNDNSKGNLYEFDPATSDLGAWSLKYELPFVGGIKETYIINDKIHFFNVDGISVHEYNLANNTTNPLSLFPHPNDWQQKSFRVNNKVYFLNTEERETGYLWEYTPYGGVHPADLRIKFTEPTAQLSWKDGSAEKNAFLIEKAESESAHSSDLQFVALDTVAGDVTTYQDKDVKRNSYYRYRISELYPEGKLTGKAANFNTLEVPQITVTSSDQSIFIGLPTYPKQPYFNIERTDSTNNFLALSKVYWGHQFTDETVTPETLYYYRANAFSDFGTTEYSKTIAAMIVNAPSDLQASENAEGGVKLRWIDKSHVETGFIIERDSRGSFAEVARIGANETEYFDSLIYQRTNKYRVKAFNSISNSVYSEEILLDAIVNGVGDSNKGISTLYPNPARDQIRINNVRKSDEVKIFNLYGVELKIENEWSNAEQTITFKIDNLPEGLYLIKVARVGSREIKSFIKKNN